MKKAVIATGGRQYLVTEGDELDVNFLPGDKKEVSFDALLVIDGDNVTVGTPVVDKVKVTASVIESSHKGEKVTAIRYKAKKRVKTIRGHRQSLSTIKINKIA